MNFTSGIYDAGIANTKSYALLHESPSLQQYDKSPPKWFGKQTSVQRPQEVAKISRSSKTPSVPARSCSAPWLNSFLHKSARYADFLATEEVRNNTNTAAATASLASNAGASIYAKMRRDSSRPLFNANGDNSNFCPETALDELLFVDKWLEMKYGPPEEQNHAEAGDTQSEFGGSNSVSSGRGDSEPILVPATPRGRRLCRLDPVTESSNHEANPKEGGKYCANTMPHDLQELFSVGNRKSPSTCSLPDFLFMEVVGRVLAAEG